MKLLLIAVVSLAGISTAQASTDTKDFSAKAIVRIQVENKTGNIKILGQNTNKITVTAEKIKFNDKCTINYKQNEEVIEVESDKKSFFSDADCEVNFTILVPKKIDLELKSGGGNIDVKDTNGKLEIKVGSGKVNVQSEVTFLDALAGSGDIEVHGLTGNANVKVGSGNMKFTYTKDPGPGELDIKSGSGDADLFFPPKMRIHSKTIVGSGETYNEIGDFKDAKFLVSFKAGSGSLNIKSTGKPAE